MTFCFTDIEGSTRLARRLEGAWRGVLERHDELLRQVWRDVGGVEVKTEGDSFFVAFEDVADALRGALAAQASIAAEGWPVGADIRVRIGLHTGSAELVASAGGEDYVGVDVHKAARVVAAAHGRQVLLSAAAAEAATSTGRLPDGASLRDLGAFSLKGFDEAERLWQLEHPSLPRDTPRPRAQPADAHNLPLLRTTFVGRSAERERITSLCARGGLVTIVGPGGAGKTRTALEVGRALAPEVADGVWAVFLAGESAGADVPATVARALGVADTPGLSLTDAICASIGDRRLVVILDNCEHVIEGAARVAAAVLETCPNATVLATSRRPLVVRGELVWSLPTLDVPAADASSRGDVMRAEAAQLFVDRAAGAKPGFELSDENAAAVARICRGVEGLPLALELAAAAARSIPLAALADRIEDPGRLLRGNTSDDPRQQTIDGLISWSYDLLDDVQQAVFRRLAVFRGGWTLAAAEVVCAGGVVGAADVLPALADLVEQSLINIDADDRYRMLVLIRGFAARKLRDAGEDELVHRRFVTYYTGWSREVGGGARVDVLRRTEPELDNLRRAFDLVAPEDPAAAFELAMSCLGAFLLNRSHYEELDGLYEAVEGRLSGDEQAELLVQRAQLARVRGDLVSSLALADGASAVLTAESRMQVRVAVLAQRGQALLGLGDRAGALQAAREGLELDIGALARAQLLELVGQVVGDPGESLAALHEAARLYDQSGERLRAAAMRIDMAERLFMTGDRQAAEQAVSDVLRLACEDGIARLEAHAHYVRGRLAVLVGEGAAAVEDLSYAIELMGSLGERRVLPYYLAERALAHLDAGDLESAASGARKAIDDLVEIRLAQAYGMVLGVAAVVLAAVGRPAEAAAAAAAAIAAGEVHERIEWQLAELASELAVAPGASGTAHGGATATAPDAEGALERARAALELVPGQVG